MWSAGRNFVIWKHFDILEYKYMRQTAQRISLSFVNPSNHLRSRAAWNIDFPPLLAIDTTPQCNDIIHLKYEILKRWISLEAPRLLIVLGAVWNMKPDGPHMIILKDKTIPSFLTASLNWTLATIKNVNILSFLSPLENVNVLVLCPLYKSGSSLIFREKWI